MEKTDTLKRTQHLAILAVAATAFLAHSAAAVLSCNTTRVFSTNTTLSDDYQCTIGDQCNPCISVTNGATLELNGHTITCAAGSNDCLHTAIQASGGAKIYGGTASNSANSGRIQSSGSGRWYNGITAASGSPGELVDSVFISTSQEGVQYFKDVTNSVFENCAYCIDTLGTARLIQDNYIDMHTGGSHQVYYGIRAGPGSVDLNLGFNYVRNWSQRGIYVNVINAHNANVHDNVVGGSYQPNFGATPFNFSVSGGGTVSLSGNLCADGGTFNSQPVCPDPTPPFTLP